MAGTGPFTLSAGQNGPAVLSKGATIRWAQPRSASIDFYELFTRFSEALKIRT
jgi:hypothetical protein